MEKKSLETICEELEGVAYMTHRVASFKTKFLKMFYQEEKTTGRNLACGSFALPFHSCPLSYNVGPKMNSLQDVTLCLLFSIGKETKLGLLFKWCHSF